MDIFDVIRRDHEKHRTLVGLLVKTSGDSKGRRELFERLEAELSAHAKAEEMSLYASLMAEDDTVGKARHSVAEHKEVDDFLKDLRDTDRSSPGWLAAARDLRERLEHHMDEEEKQVFPLAGRIFSDEDKLRLATVFREEKEAEMKRS
jgi:hemerythrin superfamily protein